MLIKKRINLTRSNQRAKRKEKQFEQITEMFANPFVKNKDKFIKALFNQIINRLIRNKFISNNKLFKIINDNFLYATKITILDLNDVLKVQLTRIKEHVP